MLTSRQPPVPREITLLLRSWADGDDSALERLIPLVMLDLHRIAERELNRKHLRDHTLQPTALVNELFLRLLNARKSTWANRDHFYAAAATVMRRLLVDYARRRRSVKRGGDVQRSELSDAFPCKELGIEQVIMVDDAVTQLADLDPSLARIVELRYFVGLSIEETAAALGMAPATIKRRWNVARAWLFKNLSTPGASQPSPQPAGLSSVVPDHPDLHR